MKQTGLLMWFGFRLCLCNIRLVILQNSADVGTHRSQWHHWLSKICTSASVSVVNSRCVYAALQRDLWLSSYLSFALSVVPVKVHPGDRIMCNSKRCSNINAMLAAVTCCSVHICSAHTALFDGEQREERTVLIHPVQYSEAYLEVPLSRLLTWRSNSCLKV